ncbi:hypothetical protein BOTBODRAFT_176100 [Botryobasidium botryosum FD-172 SS1]|uniref:Uncharacterized protein n=1 Tax=Botryobasidium botryosum (strain FD-172 SS1) TaxID=930990 RepID=A0A067MN28_BOTB1|nr:hypothetical protein BOTBODRAFT_176100 [Botryobasidium botryosum FD-172 SS1]
MEHAKTIISQKSLHLLDELVRSIRHEVPMIANQSLQLQRFWEEEVRFKAVSSVMLHEAACLRAKVNNLASINAVLPNEILTHIFELGALEDIKDLAHLPVFSRTVSHVCRLWRGISIATPALWTLFHPLLPPEVTSRAKESLLDFVIHPYKIWVNSEYEPADIPAFGHQLVRARSLRLILWVAAHPERDLMLMSCPAPHLTTLFICDTPGRGEPISLPDQLFAGHHPRLSEISIHWCVIPWATWTTSLLSNLCVLELVGIAGKHQITMPAFLSILRACPQLQILHLDNAWPFVVFGPHRPVEPVALPALRSFRWVSASNVSATNMLLRSIIAHRTVRVELCAAITDEVEVLLREGEERSFDDSVTLLEAATPRPSALRLNHSHRIHIPDLHGLEFDSDAADHVTIIFPPTAYPYEGDHISLLSNLANRWSFEIQFIALSGMTEDDADHLIYFFHALPNIATVSLDYCECDDRLVGALTAQSWAHRIDEISFRHSDIKADTILDFARSRVPGSGGSDRADLSPLRRLVFNQCEFILDETLESLKALVPEVTQLRPYYGP